MLDTASPHLPRTIQCQKEVFKYLREARGLSQAELAQKSGYTVRLIGKAESGESIAIQTAEDLADALSTTERQLYWEDLSCDPVALAREYIGGLYIHQRNIIEHIRHFLDEDILFRINGDPQQIPFAGDWRGVAGAQQAFERFFSVIEVPAGHDHRPHYHFIGQGTDAVIWGESWMHPIGQKMDQPMPLSILLRFRKGKLYYFEDQIDTQLAARVL